MLFVKIKLKILKIRVIISIYIQKILKNVSIWSKKWGEGADLGKKDPVGPLKTPLRLRAEDIDMCYTYGRCKTKTYATERS